MFKQEVRTDEKGRPCSAQKREQHGTHGNGDVMWHKLQSYVWTKYPLHGLHKGE